MKKILILAANPKNTARLRLDEEVREIQEGLQRAKQREQFDIQAQWAVRLRDLRRALLDHEPQIVHFSGHGEVNGLMVEDEQGNAVLVSAEALAGLFKLFAEKIECVLLNACYSEPQAQAIHQHIPSVIGMNAKVGDQAAVEFAVGFYDALGAGRPVAEAFEFGKNAVALYGLPEHLTPVLLQKLGVSAALNVTSPAAKNADKSAEYQEAYDVLTETIKRLRKAVVLETNPATKFQLEHQLAAAEKERADIEQKMT